MAFYIWLDKNGVETGRKPKTRGRPPVGAVANEDGNSYISLDENNVPKIPAPTKVMLNVEPQSDDEDTENGQIKHRKSKKYSTYKEIEYDGTPNEVAIEAIKCFRETTKVHMKDFLKCCFVDPVDFIITDKIIILNKVVIVADTDLLNIQFNSVYSRIEIDIEENVTRVWTVCPKNPTFYIQDLFLDFDTDFVFSGENEITSKNI